VEMLVQNNTPRTYTSHGKPADVVNLLFVGSRDEMRDAFKAANWTSGGKVSSGTVYHEFLAFLTASNYSGEPVTTQYLDGRRQDMTWQKSFNSYSKREHVRFWEETEPVMGQQAWLGAYARETSAVLSITNHKFIHHIDRNLDDGVNMLVRDLTLAGCVQSVQLFDRPDVQGTFQNATGDAMTTDGELTVVQLRACHSQGVDAAHAKPLIPIRPRSRIVRYLRTQVLVYKSDVVRGNLIYSGYFVACLGIHRLRHHRGQVDDFDDGLPLSPVSPDTLFPQISLTGASGR